MDKKQSKELIDTAVADFIDICPHCGTKAHLEMIFNDSHTEKGGHLVYYIVFRCRPCKKLVVETYRFNQNEYARDVDLRTVGWEDKFPQDEVLFVKKFEGVVPQNILDDFNEGVSCLANKNLRAAVGMFRRSLQSALIDKGCDKDQDLIDQIRNVQNLTQEIKDWAHNIRIFGNWGAHPQDDNLRDVTLEVATEAQNFLEEFFNYVYVMPHRVAEARKRNNPEPAEEDNEGEE